MAFSSRPVSCALSLSSRISRPRRSPHSSSSSAVGLAGSSGCSSVCKMASSLASSGVTSLALRSSILSNSSRSIQCSPAAVGSIRLDEDLPDDRLDGDQLHDRVADDLSRHVTETQVAQGQCCCPLRTVGCPRHLPSRGIEVNDLIADLPSGPFAVDPLEEFF